MAKDPTAKAASRNLEGTRRAAFIQYHDEDGPARIWLDPATFRTLQTLVVSFTDDSGAVHIRFKENATALLEQDGRHVTSKGNNS